MTLARGARRRAFLARLGALAVLPAAGRAQQPASARRVGIILTTSPLEEMLGAEPRHPGVGAFLREMRSRGYAEGRNLLLLRRTAAGDFARYPEIVAELARLNVDVIVAAGNNALYASARAAAGSVPFVMIASSEPDRAGLVVSLAKPGGNFTGLTIDVSPEIEVKRLELLKAVLPAARRVAYLATHAAWEVPYALAVRRAAAQFGVILEHVPHTPADYSGAFASIAARPPDALFASFSAETFAHRREIAEFALAHRLPGIFPYQEMADSGGLLSFGMSVPDLFRRLAHYVDRILRGARPGDLPIERPTKFELVVNLRSARAIGVVVPQPILLRADRVIE
ncbi:MAG: ABC transporter substrate-binding protein [Betaproteobacteria bacterium]|nr:ABC transporter substrate-binding protein [Betaproteobacteria bacterium]MDH5220213.1 ABC transporter substrate-binding protein [Betaproteobacteria bacterium]MDH5350899.1 ABC transporter substrate-binding protein [Betaproteobacteria bacterium]